MFRSTIGLPPSLFVYKRGYISSCDERPKMNVMALGLEVFPPGSDGLNTLDDSLPHATAQGMSLS
jgi:hypothetical protein